MRAGGGSPALCLWRKRPVAARQGVRGGGKALSSKPKVVVARGSFFAYCPKRVFRTRRGAVEVTKSMITDSYANKAKTEDFLSGYCQHPGTISTLSRVRLDKIQLSTPDGFTIILEEVTLE